MLTETTADLAFALMLAAARRVAEGDRFVRAGRWRMWTPRLMLGRDVWGATLGVIGWGAIGQAVARRAAGFGMRVLYAAHEFDRTECRRRRSATARTAAAGSSRGRNAPQRRARVARRGRPARAPRAERVDLARLLAEADFISLNVPLTPQTRHLIGRREFAAMKRGAILVNTARGAVVDQAALTDALRSGHLGGAGLDVTEIEPIDADDPLLKLSQRRHHAAHRQRQSRHTPADGGTGGGQYPRRLRGTPAAPLRESRSETRRTSSQIDCEHRTAKIAERLRPTG